MEGTKSAASIDEVGAFHQLAKASSLLLARGLRYVQFPNKAAVLKKGQRVSGAYVVVSGKLRVFTISPDGNEATLYQINPGETCVLALNCIFNDLLYPAWVEAAQATKVAVIPGVIYRALFDSEPVIRDLTVQAFSTLVFRLMSGLEEIHSCKLEQRLVNLLLLHASTDGNIRMTQQEIASHLGTTREVVARVLGQLASEGHIQTGRNQIVINDPVSLAEHVRLYSQTKSGKKSGPTRRSTGRAKTARR